MTEQELKNEFNLYLENAPLNEYDERAFSSFSAGDIGFYRKNLTEKFGEIEYKKCNERSKYGDHDEVETVIYFKDHDVYLSITGYYSSHNGSEFDDEVFEIVYPYTVTSIEYSSKKE